MSDQVTVEGKEYISSKRASQLSDYSQDYIGQLARGHHIDAQRVGGLWYVSMESLLNYKITAEAYKPEPPLRKQLADPDSLVSFDGKDYVSAARAAKITGYHQDYVGQLARSGTVMARQVGNRWYVERDAILTHKKEKDALLAAVQSASVGLLRSGGIVAAQHVPEGSGRQEEPVFTYTKGEGDLIPVLDGSDTFFTPQKPLSAGHKLTIIPATRPLRVLPKSGVLGGKVLVKSHQKPERRIHGKTISYATTGAIAFTIVIVLMFGLSTVGKPSTYAQGIKPAGYMASAAEAFSGIGSSIGDFIENLIVPELSYRRSD